MLAEAGWGGGVCSPVVAVIWLLSSLNFPLQERSLHPHHDLTPFSRIQISQISLEVSTNVTQSSAIENTEFMQLKL